MDSSTCDLMQFSTSFAKMVRDCQLYNQKLGVLHSPRDLTYQKREPPGEGWVKINFDAHVGVNSQRGLGVVVPDQNDVMLLMGTRRVEANWNAHISEASDALFAVEIARRMGYEYVHLEGESLVVIYAMAQHLE